MRVEVFILRTIISILFPVAESVSFAAKQHLHPNVEAIGIMRRSGGAVEPRAEVPVGPIPTWTIDGHAQKFHAGRIGLRLAGFHGRKETPCVIGNGIAVNETGYRHIEGSVDIRLSDRPVSI